MDVVSLLPEALRRTNGVHRQFGTDQDRTILSVGFLSYPESPPDPDRVLTFTYYGALLLLRGTGRYIGPDGCSVPLAPGCFIQRRPGIRHRTPVDPDSGWLECYVCLGRPIYESLLAAGIPGIGEPVLAPGLDPGLVQRFVALHGRLGARETPSASCLADAVSLVCLALQLDADRRAAAPDRLPERLDRLLSLRPDGRVSLEEAANEAGLGVETYRKRFRAQAGVPPHRYMILRRMSRARVLLADPGHSVESVALSLGYPDTATFTHQFRQYAGIAPLPFRRRLYG